MSNCFLLLLMDNLSLFGDIEVINEAVVDNETEEVVETEVLSEAEIENAEMTKAVPETFDLVVDLVSIPETSSKGK